MKGFAYQIFGESHGPAIGVVMEGLPSGLLLDMGEVSWQMDRRRAKKGGLSTTRIEGDVPKIVSGFYQGRTTGTPLCAMIANNNTRSQDYAATGMLARPSHGDYAGFVRYKGFNDPRGGGHFSGRLTAPLVFAGTVARQILRERGIEIGAHVLQIGPVQDDRLDMARISRETLLSFQKAALPVLSEGIREKMEAEIQSARMDCDSVGGIIECAALGLPCGLGEPGQDSIESLISRQMFAVPAVKGIEFGAGFAFAGMRGSEANDPMEMKDGQVTCLTNNNGGITGGIANGMPLVFRVAIKPTASIAKPQKTVDLETMENGEIAIKGRHDPCILSRAAVVIESAAALALLTVDS